MSESPIVTREQIENLKRLGKRGPTRARVDPDDNTVTCHRCDYEWDYTGSVRNPDCPNCRTRTILHTAPDLADTRGVSLRCCNAIRCAALDGWSFGMIARQSSLISSIETARKHARGECKHGKTRVPRLTEPRGPGYLNNRKITARDCRRLRAEWDAGDYDSFAAAGRAYDCFRTTAKRHIVGECDHSR